ncbi:MAG: insulinase family protein [Oscillospiraceae bacterium]|nr:insulinase family protein [Oscillospiraceae bacterium]
MTEKVYPQLGENVFWETLENGLTVAVVPKPGFSKKLCYFVTDYGAIHTHFTEDGKQIAAPAGIAHYLEHKMFDMPEGEVSSQFAAIGADVNAFTSYDMTAYYFSCTGQFEKALSLLLEFVSTPYFTKESVQKEQGIIGQEIEMNVDSPDTAVFERLMGCMYENHPINTPILGTRESIAEITPEVLYQCHKAFYSPENMLLCVVGDVDPERVCTIAREILPKEKKEKTPRIDRWEEPETVLYHSTETEMEVAMPLFQIGFKCPDPGRGEAAVRQEFVADLACEALFGESSDLYLRMYEEGIIDNSFGGGFETVSGMGMLSISGDSDHPEKVRQAIIAQAQRLCREGIPEESLLRMKRSALGRRIRALDSFSSLIFRICAYYFSGFDYLQFPTIYERITANELTDFLYAAVREENCAISIIRPIINKEKKK